VTDLLTDGSGRIRGVSVHDRLGGNELEVRAARVIDATGVWLGDPASRLGGSTMKLIPSRGTHLVFERDRLPLKTGMTLRVPGRVVFVIPYPGIWLVGTTDVGDNGAPDRPVPTADEVDEILENVNHVLEADLTRDDAVAAYAGLRPLVGVPGGDTARVSREHTIHRERSGLVRVSGGKYTTYRLMARDAVDYVLEGDDPMPRSRTAQLPIIGAASREQLDRLAAELASETGLDRARTGALVDRHGTRAREVVELGREQDLLRPLADDRSELEAEVAWAVEQELALSLDDVLSRRLRLSMSRRDRGASLAARVAQVAGARLGWDGQRQAAEVEQYLEAAHREYDVPGA
jgi:glycerol-3-phosphate dehydrogenase